MCFLVDMQGIECDVRYAMVFFPLKVYLYLFAESVVR